MKILSYLYWRQPDLAKELHSIMPHKEIDLEPKPEQVQVVVGEKNKISMPVEEWERLMQQPPRPGRG